MKKGSNCMDLTPLDFFVWGHLTSVVYGTHPADFDDRKRRITADGVKKPALLLI